MSVHSYRWVLCMHIYHDLHLPCVSEEVNKNSRCSIAHKNKDRAHMQYLRAYETVLCLRIIKFIINFLRDTCTRCTPIGG